MKNNIYYFMIIISFFFYSCNSKKENYNYEDYNWIYGKRFVQQNLKTIEPEIGGPNFIEFQTKDNIEFKQGDIVSKVKIEFKKDKIFVINELMGNNIVFTIIDNKYLLDEYRLKWLTIR